MIAFCNSAYIVVAADAIHNIYQGMIGPNADSKTCKRLILAANVIVCIPGIVLALRMNDIIQMLSMGYGLMTASCLIPSLSGAL